MLYYRFAVDLIIQYWEKLPKNSQDRLLFEQIQSRKKDPILLLSSNAHQGERLEAPFPSAPHTNKTTALFTMKSTDQQPKTTFHATASSSLPAATPAVKKQQNLSDIFRSVSSAVTSAVIGGSKKGKEKQDSNHTKSVAIVKRTPIVVANEEDDLSKTESEDERETGYTESYRSTPAEEDEERDEIIDSEDDEVVTISPKLKRKRTSYSDYFLEQHEKKKRRESQDGNESDSSLTSSIVSDKSTLKGEAAGNDQIIFDEYYSKEPPMDWKTLAVKVEYIGKELPESPLYCTVKW
jgi:hypothetical protein